MKTVAELNCIEAEVEYREWSKCPQWYCVKTTLHTSGKIESEVVADENSGIPIAIQTAEKPLDGVFETMEATTYYTYCRGYEEAAKQVALAKMMTAAMV